MSLSTMEASEVLEGILNHARAGNFDQVSIETRILLDRMQAVLREGTEHASEFQRALPPVSALVSDCRRSDETAVIEHVEQAKEALGITPGVTPAWVSGRRSHEAPIPHPSEEMSPAEPPGYGRAGSNRPHVPSAPHSTTAPPGWAPPRTELDLNTASPEEIQRAFHINEDHLRQILRNRPYRSWQEFEEKNPGFSEPMLRSLQEAGVSIGPIDLHKITW